MYLKFILTIWFSLTLAVLADRKTYNGDKVFRLFPVTEEHRNFLIKLYRGEYDFWSDVIRGQPVDVHIERDRVSSFAQFVNATGIPYRITIEDVQGVLDEADAERLRDSHSPKSGDIVGTYVGYDDIVAWANGMCAQYPELATCHYFGTSSQGRRLHYMKLGRQPIGSNNAIFLEAGIHAREWINPATTIYVVDRLLSTYDSDPTAKRMLDNWNFYVVLVTNPDGYEYSRNTDRLWRKTRSRHDDNGQCFGVDPNRNYDIDWSVTGSSDSPCSDIYHGPYAFSEPETKAISDLILEHKSELRAFFAIHSYSQLWMIPYGYTEGVRPPDFSELLRVANIGGSALMAVNNKKWEIGNGADILYACSGASDDWAKLKAGIKYSYTLELRPAKGSINGFVLPESDILPSGKEIYAGLVAAIDVMVRD